MIEGMYLVIAFHHARAQHVDDLLAYMLKVRTAVIGAPGLITFDAWRRGTDTLLAGVSVWESSDAFHNALPLLGSLQGERRSEWSERPDDVYLFDRAEPRTGK